MKFMLNIIQRVYVRFLKTVYLIIKIVDIIMKIFLSLINKNLQISKISLS